MIGLKIILSIPHLFFCQTPVHAYNKKSSRNTRETTLYICSPPNKARMVESQTKQFRTWQFARHDCTSAHECDAMEIRSSAVRRSPLFPWLVSFYDRIPLLVWRVECRSYVDLFARNVISSTISDMHRQKDIAIVEERIVPPYSLSKHLLFQVVLYE